MKTDPRMKCCLLSAVYFSFLNRCQVELPVLILTGSVYLAPESIMQVGLLNVNVSTFTRYTQTYVNCSFFTLTWGCGRNLLKDPVGPRARGRFSHSADLAPLGSGRELGLTYLYTCLQRMGLAEFYMPYFGFVWMDSCRMPGVWVKQVPLCTLSPALFMKMLWSLRAMQTIEEDTFDSQFAHSDPFRISYLTPLVHFFFLRCFDNSCMAVGLSTCPQMKNFLYVERILV